jgi:DNA topoisomerase-1
VKDVEANAERESGERILGKDPKQVSRFCLGKFTSQIGRMMREKIASLMPDQNIGNIGLKKH